MSRTLCFIMRHEIRPEAEENIPRASSISRKKRDKVQISMLNISSPLLRKGYLLPEGRIDQIKSKFPLKLLVAVIFIPVLTCVARKNAS